MTFEQAVVKLPLRIFTVLFFSNHKVYFIILFGTSMYAHDCTYACTGRTPLLFSSRGSKHCLTQSSFAKNFNMAGKEEEVKNLRFHKNWKFYS